MKCATCDHHEESHHAISGACTVRGCTCLTFYVPRCIVCGEVMPDDFEETCSTTCEAERIRDERADRLLDEEQER